MSESHESRLGRLYRVLYDGLCGRHPNLFPWHFQFLDCYYLYRSLRKHLAACSGVILDVGCGEKPYQDWFGKVDRYIGIDTYAGAKVDFVIDGRTAWPLPDESVDVVVCTQVLEHVEDLAMTLGEIRRVLRPGGTAVLSFPFIFNEHGAPYDFRRFSAYGAERLFPDWRLVCLERQGGIGSTLIILLFNYIETAMNQYKITRLLKGAILPLWMGIALLGNLLGLLGDRLDGTGNFYNNILAVYSKTARDDNC